MTCGENVLKVRLFLRRWWIYSLLVGPKEAGKKQREHINEKSHNVAPQHTQQVEGASVCTCVGVEYI